MIRLGSTPLPLLSVMRTTIPDAPWAKIPAPRSLLVFVVALDASGTEVFLELPAPLSGIDPFSCSLN